MKPTDLLRAALRAAALMLAAWLAGAAPAALAQSDTRGCDISGWDKPCTVRDGVYRALVPKGDGPFPAMVYLYGSGGQSVEIANHPLLIASVVNRGYALIVPAALDMQYQKDVWDTGWGLRNEPGKRRDEADFVRQVIEDAAQRFELDRERILLVGQSRGAFLIWEITCHAPDTAAAYAVHAGGYLGALPESCVRPVRFLDSHGLSDPIVPFAGPPVVSGGVTMAGIGESLDLLARTNRCKNPEPKEAQLMSGMARQSWEGCAAGSSLDLVLHAGGHSMPPEWFGAVLDWFEEPPAEVEDVKPVSRTASARSTGDQFKALPGSGGKLLTASQGSGIKRLQPPAAGSKKLSQ